MIFEFSIAFIKANKMFDTNFKIHSKKLQFIKKECQANLITQF